MPPPPASRIPDALKAVFLESNSGKEVHVPPPFVQVAAAKVFCECRTGCARCKKTKIMHIIEKVGEKITILRITGWMDRSCLLTLLLTQSTAATSPGIPRSYSPISRILHQTLRNQENCLHDPTHSVATSQLRRFHDSTRSQPQHNSVS